MSELSNVTAIIFAGGLGKRLRKFVSDRPKVMAEINGRPFLYYFLDQLAEVSIGRVVISTGFMEGKSIWTDELLKLSLTVADFFTIEFPIVNS